MPDNSNPTYMEQRREVIFSDSIGRKDGEYVTVNSVLPSVQTTTLTYELTGSPIGTGIAGDLSVPVTGTIRSVTLLGDQSGDIVIDIWKDTYANYPPTVADTITAAAKPTISSGVKYTDSTLTGWTTAITAGDTLRFNVDSVATFTRMAVVLEVEVQPAVILDQVFFTAYQAMEVIAVSEVHAVLGTDAGAVTLDIEKLTGTEAPGAGTSILATEFNLKSTINTVVTKNGRLLSTARQLKPTNRLALVATGDLTAVDNVQVTLYLKFSGRGDYR